MRCNARLALIVFEMTGEQSRQLKVGDKVCWQNDQADGGTVTETSWSGLTIKWDNRSEQRVLHNDTGRIGDHHSEVCRLILRHIPLSVLR